MVFDSGHFYATPGYQTNPGLDLGGKDATGNILGESNEVGASSTVPVAEPVYRDKAGFTIRQIVARQNVAAPCAGASPVWSVWFIRLSSGALVGYNTLATPCATP